jgi:chromosome segregation ATPase
MIKSIIKVALLLIVGILGYNYFWGSPEEKAQSKEIIGKAVDVGKAGVGLLKEEIGKFKSGKYDDALDNIGTALNQTKEKLKQGSKLLDEVAEWQEKKEDWEKKSDELKETLANEGDNTKASTQEAIKKLNREAEELAEEGKQLEKEMVKERQ